MIELNMEELEPQEAPSTEFWEGVVIGLGIVGAGVAIAVAVAT
ncbi:hypothetical protein J2W22_000367 [Sphingomonas kyeonggiensis]|nr:daptide-type RiPP [Sphingomonas kyeonggiensis]MDQ0248320.1 hypothetical protein [Sphingomonas kyeonggiensis]